MVGDIIQPTHLLFILVVALLVLGPKRLPEVGRTLGSGLRDFRAAISGESTSQDDKPHNLVETEPEDELEPETDLGPAFDDEATADASDDAGTDHSPWAVPDSSDDDTVVTDVTHDDAASVATVATDESHSSTVPTAERAPARTTAASSSGFASALAESRQRATDDEPADDE